jgi:hypothetical protein
MSELYGCYLCGQLNNTVTKFRAHLYWHNGLAQLTMPILFRQAHCKASFSTVYNFIRHLQSYYSGNGSLSEPCVSVSLGTDPSTDTTELCNSQLPTVSVKNNSSNKLPDAFLEDTRPEAIALMAGQRANSSIPFSVISRIIVSLGLMTTWLMSCFQIIAESSLLKQA